MKMNDEIRINAPRERVFAALNNPEILKQAIPGCEEIEQISDSEMTVTVVIKVGPVKAKFKGEITLSDMNPPESYTISGKGKGGPAGFAKGSAKIQLEEDGGGTILRYDVHADVGGKLAQLGGRLIDGTAKKLAGEFFVSFRDLVGVPIAEPVEEAVEEPAPIPVAARKISPLIWVLGAAAILIAVLLFM